MKLSELVARTTVARWENRTGAPCYRFVIDSHPGRRPDVIGDPPQPESRAALLCRDAEGVYIACKVDSLDHAYEVSHEIAEHRCGHQHTVEMFTEQALILSRWLRGMGG